MKKLISLIIVVALMISSVAYAALEKEDDGGGFFKPGDEYKDGIQEEVEEVTYVTGGGSVFYSDMSDYSVVGILGALEIMGASEGTQFKPNVYISRGEFVEGVLKLLNINYSGVSNAELGFFYDVEEGSKWYEPVYTALSLGIISGYGNNSFRPDSVITYSEAVSCVMRALGYTDQFLPYETLAKRIDLLDGFKVNNVNALTRVEMAKLLYNALEVPTYEFTGIVGGESVYAISGDSVLERIWKLGHFEGQVTANFSETIGKMAPDRDCIVIDDSFKYKTKNYSDQHLLGYMTEYYCDEDNNLIYIRKDNNVEELAIDSEDLFGLNGNSVEYSVGNKIKRASLKKGYKILYNGRVPEGNYTLKELFDIGDGKITLISNDSGSGYEIVIIEEYRNYIVDSTSVEGNIVRILTKDGQIKLDADDTNLVVFDANGVEQDVYKTTIDGVETIDISAIKAGTVVSVFTEYKKLKNGYPTEDVKQMKIVVSDKKVSGVFKMRSENTFTIDETDYELASWKEYSTLYTYLDIEKQVLGGQIEYYLDYNDRIVENTGDTLSDEWQYAYLISAATEGGLSSNVKMQIYTLDGKVDIYYVAEKMKINGKRVKDDKILDTIRTSASYLNRTIGEYVINKEYGQLIRMKAEEKTVKEIQTLVQSEGKNAAYPDTQLWRDERYTKDANTKFTVYYDQDGIYCYSDNKNSFGKNYGQFRKPTITLHVPCVDSADPDDYKIKANSDNPNLVMDFYDVENMTPAIAVCYTNITVAEALPTGANNSTPFIMFDDVSRALNEDGEEIIKISVLTYNGITDEYYATDETVYNDLCKLEKGGLLKLFGAGKKVTKVEYPTFTDKDGVERPIGPSYLPWECLETGNNVPGITYNAGVQMFEVYDIFSADYFSLQNRSYINGDERENKIVGFKRPTAAMQGGILMYDSSKGRDGICKIASTTDMRTVRQYGSSGCTIAFVCPNGGSSWQYILYNLDANGQN